MLKIVSENFIHDLLLFLGLFLKISRWVPLYLTSISYNAGKITVQCLLSVEEFKPQPLPL